MRILIIAVLVALLLAGCGGRDDARTGSADPPDAFAEARALLTRATQELPDILTVRMDVRTASGTPFSYVGTLDRRTNTSYLELQGDARTLASLAGAVGAEFYLGNGLIVHVRDGATLYLANGTAFVDPAPGTTRIESLIPRIEDGPLGTILRSDEMIARLGEPSVVLVDVRDTLAIGDRPAIEIDLTRDGVPATLLITRADPPRIVRLATTLAPERAHPSDPLANASISGTLHDDPAEIVAPAPAAARAMGLSYVVSRRDGNLTWNFVGAAGVPIEEVEIRVQNATGQSGGDPSAFPTQWSFRLDEARRSVGNVTLAFLDADEDGTVSRGDTLVATAPNAASMPPLVLYDLVTGTRVVPAPGALLVLALALTALLTGRQAVHSADLRRKYP